MFFVEHGLSAAQVSSLFAIWSVTAFALEVPSGVWADVYSRRALLTLAPLSAAGAFALWTWLPSYPAFAAGFVLWGASGAVRSGTFQALAFTELKRVGAADAYARVIGRTEAVAVLAQLVAAAAAAPVLAFGGPHAVGAASVAVPLLCAASARLLPDGREPADPDGSAGPEGPGEEAGPAAVLRAGRRELHRAPAARRMVLVCAAVAGVTSVDEYLPLLVAHTGVAREHLPLFVALLTAGAAVGGWCAGSAAHRFAPLLAAGAVCLAVGAAVGSPAGLVAVAAAFGVFQWAMAQSDARLQAVIADRARATVTSVAGVGSEAVALLVFGGYALGSLWASAGTLFALAAVPYLLIAVSEYRRWRPGEAPTLEE